MYCLILLSTIENRDAEPIILDRLTVLKRWAGALSYCNAEILILLLLEREMWMWRCRGKVRKGKEFLVSS